MKYWIFLLLFILNLDNATAAVPMNIPRDSTGIEDNFRNRTTLFRQGDGYKNIGTVVLILGLAALLGASLGIYLVASVIETVASAGEIMVVVSAILALLGGVIGITTVRNKKTLSQREWERLFWGKLLNWAIVMIFLFFLTGTIFFIF
jgi:hypothetical protein